MAYSVQLSAQLVFWFRLRMLNRGHILGVSIGFGG